MVYIIRASSDYLHHIHILLVSLLLACLWYNFIGISPPYVSPRFTFLRNRSCFRSLSNGVYSWLNCLVATRVVVNTRGTVLCGPPCLSGRTVVCRRRWSSRSCLEQSFKPALLFTLRIPSCYNTPPQQWSLWPPRCLSPWLFYSTLRLSTPRCSTLQLTLHNATLGVGI